MAAETKRASGVGALKSVEIREFNAMHMLINAEGEGWEESASLAVAAAPDRNKALVVELRQSTLSYERWLVEWQPLCADGTISLLFPATAAFTAPAQTGRSV